MVKIVKTLLVAAIFSGAIIVSGCSNRASEEERQQLEALKAGVSSLEIQLRDKRGEKANLEKQIAETNGKIQQCQSDQEVVKKAMGGQ